MIGRRLLTQKRFLLPLITSRLRTRAVLLRGTGRYTQRKWKIAKNCKKINSKSESRRYIRQKWKITKKMAKIARLPSTIFSGREESRAEKSDARTCAI